MVTSQEPSTPWQSVEELHQALLAFAPRFKQELAQVIVGQEQVLDLLIIALFCNGHVLLTGVPGLAKTLLIKALSQLFHLQFNRIQCTPDLMPSDITGVEILEELSHSGERTFRFIEGPLFTNLLLADEINRTSPRTQAALLQAMQEKQVTVSGKTYRLAAPFIVFATQNPIDSEGTYPLPEAQLDRFLFNVDVKYPSAEEEIAIAIRPTADHKPLELQPIFERVYLLGFQQLVHEVPISPPLAQWAVQFVRATRPQESPHEKIKRLLEWGAGVRASQALVMAAKAKALLGGRHAVTLEDLRAVVHPILRHRLILNFVGEAEGWTSDRLIDLLLEQAG